MAKSTKRLYTFGGNGTEPVAVITGAPVVHRKARWENAWTPEAAAVALEAVWNASPAMPTASIRWRYGQVMTPAIPTTGWIAVEKDRLFLGSYVRILFPCGVTKDAEGTVVPAYRKWYGIVDVEEDVLGGAVITTAKKAGAAPEAIATASGEQTFTAYGLEKLLADITLRRSWINSGGSDVAVQRVVPFNANGRPNRSASKIGDSFVFEADRTAAEWWSTRDIVEYLLARESPQDSTGTITVPFELQGVALGDWDRPEVSWENQTLLGLLQELVTRANMVSWRLKVSEDEARVGFEVFSLSEADITLPLTGGPKIPASIRQVVLDTDLDPSTRVALKTGNTGKVHQVRVRGSRKRSVGSFSFADNTLGSGWDGTLQSLYDAGASGSAGYSALDDEEKRTRNDAVRGQPRYEEVYSLFVPPTDWDQTVNAAYDPMFPDSAGDPVPQFMGDTFVSPTLPLYQGIDYSGTAIGDGTPKVAELDLAANLEEMPPMVFFRRPEDTTKWVAGDKLGTGGVLPKAYADSSNSRCSVAVQVPTDSHGIMLRVQGDPQHAIAKTDFAPLAVDPPVGGLDWRNCVVTMAFTWDWVEGVYPADDAIAAEVDSPRVKILWAGDRYRQDYVAPSTVLGVATDGTLLRSTTGGWIPKQGDDDDVTRLTSMARLAHAWYGTDHYVLSIETHRLPQPTELEVGDLVAEIGTQAATGGHRKTINACITEIKIAWPEGDDSATPPPVFSLITDSGELDPIQPGSGLSPRDARSLDLPGASGAGTGEVFA